MAITPHQIDLWSGNMAHLYQSLEGEILRLVIQRLNKGSDNIADWQLQKLRELHLFNSETAKLIAEVSGVSEKEVRKMFNNLGHSTIEDIDKLVASGLHLKPLPNNIDEVLRAYYNQAWGDLNNYVNQTLLSTNYGYGSALSKLYTDIINKTVAAFNTGLFTFEEALERTVRQWAQQGIKSTFIDKGGHTWSIERYVRTVLKSTMGNTYNELRTSRMSEYGVNTVVVTSHMGARLACSLIQGHVVDLRKNIPINSEYKSIYDPYWKADYGEAGGHRGVNCRHAWIPFIPGVNTNNQPIFSKAENDKVAALQKRQRELERRIVKFKKNKMVSEAMGNKSGAQSWKNSITATQAVIRKLVNSNEYLSRNYKREKVYTPLDTLLKDFRYDN
ncbi:phage minor capsid protein [Lactococcus formosensis]|uniref:phage minor capsid protein n=1 Tax=Lactococcus formosensis TaxID=1281486 RepID=UPI002434D388|nr:phage minor capsid protein [Lactococcus formosensis]MDG6161808.1 phage minor capsid protein [Lactococcus formosensis]MDG6171530.1 phage minor capsid protein [Lactococcus formosensis]